jgi:hypothetical protein
MDLFASPAPQTAASPTAGALDSTVDRIRERFGNMAVRRGSALPVARGIDETGEELSENAPGRRRAGDPPTSPARK